MLLFLGSFWRNPLPPELLVGSEEFAGAVYTHALIVSHLAHHLADRFVVQGPFAERFDCRPAFGENCPKPQFQ